MPAVPNADNDGTGDVGPVNVEVDSLPPLLPVAAADSVAVLATGTTDAIAVSHQTVSR